MKIILAEIDFPLMPTLPLNYEAGIYVYHIAHAQVAATDSSGNKAYFPAENEGQMYNIKSVYVNGEYYTSCNSVQSMRATDKTFYFDYPNQLVYVRYNDDDPPDTQRLVRFGAARGFCNKTDRNSLRGSYFNDIFYEPCLKSCGSITRKVDRMFYGVMELQSFTLSFFNAPEGEYNYSFDDWRDEDIFGQAARLLQGDSSDEYNNYEVIASGYVDDTSWDWKEYQVKVSDKRGALTRKIPTNVFTASDFPGAPTDALGKVKPIAFGKSHHVQGIPLGTDGSNWWYYLADPSVSTLWTPTNAVVVRDGSETSITPNFLSAEGIVTIQKLEIETEQPELFCDINTVDSWFAAHAIVKLLGLYADMPFTETFFDTDSCYHLWMYPTKTGIYIGKDGEQVELRVVLEKLCNAASMVLYPTCDGRIAMKSFFLPIEDEYENEYKTVHYIHPDEWKDVPKFKKPSKEYLTSVDIKYNENISEGTFDLLHYADDEQDVFDIYKVYNTKSFETCLPDLTAATTKARQIMMLSSRINKTVTRTLAAFTLNNDGTEKANWKIDIEDIIIASHERKGAPERWCAWRVLSNVYDPVKLTCRIDMQYVLDCTTEQLLHLDSIGYRSA